MTKRRLHHIWTKVRVVKLRYFLVLTVAFSIVSVYALRANNEHMIKLRAEVYAADQSNGDVQGALDRLQSYVTSNMNTDLSAGPNAVYPPIQLKYTYDRLVTAQSNQVAATNAALYPQAQAYCQAQDPVDFSGHNRVPCIEQFVESHGAATTPIPDELYKYDFISPQWSPDLAGWSLVVASLSFLCLAIVAVTQYLLKKRANA